VSSGAEEEHRVFRVGGVSYLRIPAEDPRRSAAFYEAVFGWSLRGDPDEPSFEDGTGHVIGHFIADLPVAGEAGVLAYIFVERVDETLEDRCLGRRGRHAAVPRRGPVGRDVPRPAGKRARRVAARATRLGPTRHVRLRKRPAAAALDPGLAVDVEHMHYLDLETDEAIW
jgi:catechol 2,3-dioxygenase-like lactoylglutathione lyase family enzyme